LRNPKGLTVIPEERDAWAFLDAAGITASRQQRAVIELVRGLKNAQLWSKMKAIYPFVGGTATTHKFNLKDPRDSDAAFRLAFVGGWTHASTGADPNGSNAYAETYISPSTHLTLYSTHLSYYSRENTRQTDNIDMGSYQGTGTDFLVLITPRTNDNAFSIQYSVANNAEMAISTTQTDSRGFFLGSRTSSTASSHKLFRNGNIIGTASQTAGILLSNNILIGAIPNPSPFYYTNKEVAFSTIGDGLTDTDATNLYNIVQRYQTSLGRQV
jgi:hypothetical protein